MKERLANLAMAMKLPDVRKRIFFVFTMFALYVFCAHIPLPGIDKEQLANFFAGGGLMDLLDVFVGGSLKRFSILALGIMPYINASIIFQLLVMAIPSLEQLQREGEWGQKKLQAWTRYLTVALAVLQAAGMIAMFRGANAFIGDRFITIFDILMMTSGTMFLMYIGNRITERGIGQGVSLIIFVGIMTRMPQDMAQTYKLWEGREITIANIALLVAIFLATIYGIVKVQQAERKIPVQYTKRVKGQRVYGGQSSFLPLRVNQAGVIPIIFAISVSMFPATIARLLLSEGFIGLVARLGIAEDAVRNAVNALVNYTAPGVGNHFASFLYFILVILFTYFYTAVTFNPEQIADNLQKNGGAVPGIRPGERTRDYLDKILYRITLAGALFLGFIAIMQYYVGPITGVSTFNLVGGTSLLIVVGVALDTMQQIEAQLLMRQYRGFLS